MPLQRSKIQDILKEAVLACADRGILSTKEPPLIVLETPKEQEFGDYASTIAMMLAPIEKRPPRAIADEIASNIHDPDGLIESVTVADPGYINIFLSRKYWIAHVREALVLREGYGSSDLGKGERVLIEFVSANPTGPLHVGHGRGATVGDCLARILETSGYNVEKEYYINDMGKQVESLGQSVFQQYASLLGRKVEVESAEYQGGYIKEIAREIIEQEGDRYIEEIPQSDPRKTLSYFSTLSSNKILDGIRKDLADFGISFNAWFSESELRQKLEDVINNLTLRGCIEKREGAIWFASTRFGDDKDRVLVKEGGEPTYFLSDIAYHKDKYKRDYGLLINIWGADHHGYLPRIKAALSALELPVDRLHVLFVQMVSLSRGGQPVSMSKREGEFITLREVMDEVGSDAAKFFFLMRRCDSHLDFDLELAKQQSNENPVYYVQYAHARISSIFAMAQERGVQIPDDHRFLDLLKEPGEMLLMKHIARFPDVLESAARTLEPHRLTFYLLAIAGDFHKYYNEHRVVSEDPEMTNARLLLVGAVHVVIKKALRLIGVTAPAKM